MKTWAENDGRFIIFVSAVFLSVANITFEQTEMSFNFLLSLIWWTTHASDVYALSCQNNLYHGHAIAQVVSCWLPTTATWVQSRVWSSGVCGGQSGAGQVFSEYFGFPCHSSFHQILHHNHPGQATIGQSMAAVPSGPSWTPPPTKRIYFF
jgi:hypothetical protein